MEPFDDDDTTGKTIREGLRSVARAILADGGPGQDAFGGTVMSLTEALMGVTEGASRIANAISEVACAISDLADAVHASNDSQNG
jgi:hypothetical protein